MAEHLPASEPAPSVTDSNAAPAADQQPVDKARARILDIARVDSEYAADAAQRDRDNAMRATIVAKAVPARYLQLVQELRDAVRLFNQSLRSPEDHPIPIITWNETPNVALGDPNSGDGMRVRIARRGVTFDLILRFASRAARADVPLIEGHGDYGNPQQGRTRTMLRIEGWVEKGQPIFWYSLDFKRQSTPISEVADRIVASVAANDYSLLSRDLSGEMLSE